MLRSRVLAVACLAILPAGNARAEAVMAAQVPASASPASASSVIATTVISNPAAAPSAPVDDSKPHIAATTVPDTAAAAVTTTTVAGEQPAHSPGSSSEGHVQLNQTVRIEPEAVAPAAAPAKSAPPPPPTLTAQIDLATQTMVVSEDGDAKYTWAISSGTAEFPTPRGTFRPQWTAKMWYSRKYDNAPMPHAVFINGGVAVHATSHVRNLGNPASHGCIRLAPGNAKTFYSLVQKHGLKLTRVSVHGTPKWRAPAVASRKAPRPQQYAAAEDDGGWWGSSFNSSPKKYQPTSAYDAGFTKQRRYRPAPPPGYVYVNQPQQRIYRNAQGQRVVYVQRPQRRAYYYNNSGYGYGGGW